MRYSTETIDNNVLVVAGAGSGKTRVLTERIKYLLDNGTSPHEIVAITYTRLAADEMKTRLKDVDGVGDMFIGTLHAFANMTIRNNAETLNLENYKVFNTQIEIDLIKELIITNRLEHLTMKRFIEYKEMEDAYNRLLISQEELDGFLMQGEMHELRKITEKERSSDEDDYEGQKHYTTTHDLMARKNIITFDDMLEFAIEYFENSGIELKHLLVDEFQDIGHTDYRFLEALKPVNRFFVGDDYQAIYGFKGASVDIFLNSIRDKNVTKIYLEENYRNNNKIIKLGEKVIQQTADYVPKKAKCNNPKDGTDSIKILSKDKLRDVLEELKEEEVLSNIAVLCRNNKQVMEVAMILGEFKVNYDCIRKGFFDSNAELERILSSNKVKVMTVHQAKGLEFDYVIGYGKFPIVTPNWNKNDEERRVFYVLITRAENRLTILN